MSEQDTVSMNSLFRSVPNARRASHKQCGHRKSLFLWPHSMRGLVVLFIVMLVFDVEVPWILAVILVSVFFKKMIGSGQTTRPNCEETTVNSQTQRSPYPVSANSSNRQSQASEYRNSRSSGASVHLTQSLSRAAPTGNSPWITNDGPMQCNTCGEMLPRNAIFCVNCGDQV